MERGQRGGARAVAVLAGVLVLGVAIGAGAVLALGGDRSDGAAAAVCHGLDARIEREIAPAADVVVFLSPDAEPRQVDAVRTRLREVEGVAEMSYTDAEAAFAEFVEMFEHDPEMVAAVNPDILPTSFRIVMSPGADLPETTVDGMAGVYRVVRSPLPADATVADAVRHFAVGGAAAPDLELHEAEDDIAALLSDAPSPVRDDLAALLRGMERRRTGLDPGAEAIAAAERIVLAHAADCAGR